MSPPQRLRINRGRLTLVGFQSLSAYIFVAVSPKSAGIDFGTALWHCWATGSTVGYGQVASQLPTTPAVRAWASAHILLSVSLFATAVGQLLDLEGAHRAARKREQLKAMEMDIDFIKLFDRDGEGGVDRMEFVVGMLTQLGVLSWADVQPFLTQFDKYDKDGSGKIDITDLELMQEEQKTSDKMKKERMRLFARMSTRKLSKIRRNRQENAVGVAPTDEAEPSPRIASRACSSIGPQHTTYLHTQPPSS